VKLNGKEEEGRRQEEEIREIREEELRDRGG
jgi:hypothetical protein